MALGGTVFDRPAFATPEEFFAKTKATKSPRGRSEIWRITHAGIRHLLLPVKTQRRPTMMAAEEARFFALLRSIIREHPQDLMLTYGGQISDFASYRLLRDHGIPAVFYLANPSYHQHEPFRDTAAVITDSAATAALYKQRLDLEVTPVGKFVQAFPPAPDDRREFCTFINPAPAKGATLFAAIAEESLRRGLDARFLVIEGRATPAPALQRLGIDDLPNVTRWPMQASMCRVWPRTKILLHPSLWHESGSRTILEALSAHVPTLATRSGGTEQMIGDSGFLFENPIADHLVEHKDYLQPFPPEVAAPWVDRLEALLTDDARYAAERERAPRLGNPPASRQHRAGRAAVPRSGGKAGLTPPAICPGPARPAICAPRQREGGIMALDETADLVQGFAEAVYLAARPILDDAALAHFRAMTLDDEKLAELNRSKRLWMVDPTALAAARSPHVKAVLDALLGERGYYLWGAQVIDRVPGQAHPWYCDIETAREGMVSLWVGVSGVTAATSLQAIPGSHLMGAPIQAFWSSGDSARINPEAAALLDRVRQERGVASLVPVDCSDGQGIFFDCRLWHGTFNTADAPSRALLLQLGRHGTPVRWVKNATAYPFDYDPVRTPMALSLKGDPDLVANKYLLPKAGGGFAVPPARTAAAPALVAAEGQGWTMHPYFRAETPIMQHLNCHASVLRGGFMPHLPHAHDDEEILIVLSGWAAIFAQHGDRSVWRGISAGPGDFFYYPARHRHTIMNAALGDGGEPLTYMMFRWQTSRQAGSQAQPFRVPAEAWRGGRGFATDRPRQAPCPRNAAGAGGGLSTPPGLVRSRLCGARRPALGA